MLIHSAKKYPGIHPDSEFLWYYFEPEVVFQQGLYTMTAYFETLSFQEEFALFFQKNKKIKAQIRERIREYLNIFS